MNGIGSPGAFQWVLVTGTAPMSVSTTSSTGATGGTAVTVATLGVFARRRGTWRRAATTFFFAAVFFFAATGLLGAA